LPNHASHEQCADSKLDLPVILLTTTALLFRLAKRLSANSA
jgi:hypothetical protein